MAKTKNPPNRLKYLGNVLKIPVDQIPDVLSGKINRIVLSNDVDHSFRHIYAYKEGAKSTDSQLGVFPIVARYPLYISTTRTVFVDRLNIYGQGKQKFISSIGYLSFDAFVDFIEETYQLPFEGRVIEWRINEKSKIH